MLLNDFHNDAYTMDHYEAPVVEEGVYRMQLIEALKKTTSSGKQVIQMKWEILDGEHKGEEIQDDLWYCGDDKQIKMTQARLTRISNALCGRTEKVDLRALVGKEAYVMVKKNGLKSGGWKNFIGKVSLTPFEDLPPKKDVISSILGVSPNDNLPF